jgi:hypothetical protein
MGLASHNLRQVSCYELREPSGENAASLSPGDPGFSRCAHFVRARSIDAVRAVAPVLERHPLARLRSVSLLFRSRHPDGLLALRMREDHLSHHAVVVCVNLNLAIAVRPEELALLDKRHDGCRVSLYLVDHTGAPQLAVDDRNLADDGVPAGRNGRVLAFSKPRI